MFGVILLPQVEHLGRVRLCVKNMVQNINARVTTMIASESVCHLSCIPYDERDSANQRAMRPLRPSRTMRGTMPMYTVTQYRRVALFTESAVSTEGPNDEVKRREVASALNEADLSQSSTPSLAQ
jgi:hypothetical protein